MENLTGKQLGAYRVIEPLGEGGMASVYRAYQPSVERDVALKILPRHLASDPEFVARFEQEARLIASLQHVHILPVHDFGQDEGYTYIVMPYLETGTLADEIDDEALELERVLTIVRQVGSALDYAHDRGVVHRDVKPANVLIDETGNCLLTDFGIAKMVSATVKITQTGTIIGTPAYMSPEQIEGGELDGRSDIYSLGIVLFEMVTGRVPYRAETPAATFVKHLHDPLPMPSELRADLPPAVEQVILKALAKQPEERFGRARDMVRALDGAVREPAADAEPTTIVPETKEAPLVEEQAEPATERPQEPAEAAVARESADRSPLPLKRVLLFALPLLGLLGVAALAIMWGPAVAGGIQALLAKPTATRAQPAAVSSEPTSTTAPTSPPTVTAAPATRAPTHVTADPATFVRLQSSQRLYPADITGGALRPDGGRIGIGVFRGGTNLERAEDQEPIRLSGAGVLLLDARGLLPLNFIETADSVRAVDWTTGSIWAGIEGGAVVRIASGGGQAERVGQIAAAFAGPVAGSPQGRFVAAGGYRSRQVVVLAVDGSGRVANFSDHGQGVTAIAWSPDGERVASSGGARVMVWQAATGQATAALEGHENSVMDLVWFPDGVRIASASEDGTLRVWDVAAGQSLHRLYPAVGNLRSVAVSPDGTFVAAGSSTGAIPVWEVESGRLVATFEEDWNVMDLMWSRDGRLLSLTKTKSTQTGGRVTVWGPPQ